MTLPFAVAIAPATQEHAGLVLHDWHESYRVSPEAERLPRDVYDVYQRERSRWLLERSLTLVASSDGIALGWACGERASTGRLVVHYVYVKRAYRQHGLGHELVERLRSELEANDRPGIYTHRRPPWSLAFERRGWRYRPDYARDRRG